MSIVKAAHSIRSYERCLIVGYFDINFNKHIPSEIIQLCILYCFIFDEFDSNTININTQIQGINNTIATCNIEEDCIDIFCRNSHQPSGKYHWTFEISYTESITMEFGFIQNNIRFGNHKFNLWYWSVSPIEKQATCHIYLDTDNNIAIFQQQDCDDEIIQLEKTFNNINTFKLYMCLIKGKIKIEITDFNNSNWYITQLLHNKNDPISNAGYANCICDAKEKINYYSIALTSIPNVELWNQEYLLCLLILKEYDKAYNHAIKYEKGAASILKLAGYFCVKREDYKNAYKLFMLCNLNEIKDSNFYYAIAYCCREVGEFNKALKYCKLYFDKNSTDYNGCKMLSCLYDEINDIDNGKKWALKALNVAPDDNEKNTMLLSIGVYSYGQNKIEDAIKYTKEGIKHDAKSEIGLGRSNLGKYYYKLNKYEESYKHLKVAVEIDPNHPDVVGNYGVLMYYLNKIEDAFIYIEKCLLQKNIVRDRELVLDSLYIYGKILYDKGKYNESISKCMESINDNYFKKYKEKKK
eukprot:362916_1